MIPSLLSSVKLNRHMDRYIMSQIADHWLLGLTVFTLLVFFSDTFIDFMRDLQRYGIPLQTALLLVGLQIPKTLFLVMPASIFLATMLVFNQMNSHLEVIALRMSGIKLERIIAPALVLGIFITLGTYILGDWIIPLCNQQSNIVKKTMLDKGTLPVGRSQVTFKKTDKDHNLKKLIYVSGYKGNRLKASTIIDLSDPGVMQIIQSKGGQWTPTHWEFHHANVYSIFKQSQLFTFNHSDTLKIKNLLKTSGLKGDETKTAIKTEDPYSANSSTLSFFSLFKRIQLREAHNMAVNKGTYANLWEKLTTPISCLVLILMAFPLAITPPRKRTDRGFIFSILALFLFYMMRSVFVALGRSGGLSLFGLISTPYAMLLASWLPIVLLGAFALLLIQRKQRVL